MIGRLAIAGGLAMLVTAVCGVARAETLRCAYTAGAAVVAVPGRPFAAEPSGDGCWIFAALLGNGEGAGGAIAVLRNEAGRFVLVGAAPAPGDPAGLALSHDGRTLAVAAGDGVLLFDTAAMERRPAQAAATVIPLGAKSSAVYVAISPDDRLLAVSEEQADSLAIVDLAAALRGQGDSAIVGRIPQGRGPVGLAFSPDGTRLFATNQIAPAGLRWESRCRSPAGGEPYAQGVLAIVDVGRAVKEPGRAVLANVPAGCNPVRVALSPDGGTAWVTARTDDALLALSTRAGGADATPTRVYAVGSAPVGVAVRADGTQVWVANSDRFSATGAGSLTGLAPATGDTRKVGSGRFPRDLRFLPDGVTLVAAQFGSRAIQLVPTDD